jgi:hypothetical protein
MSDLKRANWDSGKEPWLSAAEWTWDEGLFDGEEKSQ